MTTSKKGVSITIGNQKGGVGKSTAVALTAIEAGMAGKKTCVIDLDGQQNMSYILLNYLGMKNGVKSLPRHPDTGKQYHITTALLGEEFDVYPTEHKNVYVLPNDGEITDMRAKIEKDMGVDGIRFLRQLSDRLKKLIDTIIEAGEFDLIIMDTPPSLTFPQLASFMTTDKVLLVTELDHLSAENGIPATLDQIQEYNQYVRSGNPIDIIGILENKVSYRNVEDGLLRKEQQKTHDDLAEAYPDLINTNLRLSLLEALKVTKIPTENKITQYRKDKRANLEVQNFINYVLKKLYSEENN